MNIAILIEPLNLRKLWIFNLGLIVLYFTMSIGFPFLKSSVLEYPNTQSLPFDGTIYPIAYVPNWLNQANLNKSLRYGDIAASEFVRIPQYDAEVLLDSDSTNKIAVLSRGTYITPYMGSYRMNFTEYDGSHLGVDIRAPLGTPVLSIANGVVVKVKNVESSDGKYVVIRHDNISYDGRTQSSYYSAYLHMDNLVAVEGTAVKKGQKIGEVGLTGITTTPHLHFQIDTTAAAFHPFWPYSTTDLKNLGLDFFEAVNVGLGKELAMKNTVHPLEFVQELEDGNSDGSNSSSNPTLVSPGSGVSSTVTQAVTQTGNQSSVQNANQASGTTGNQGSSQGNNQSVKSTQSTISAIPSQPSAPQTYIAAVTITQTSPTTSASSVNPTSVANNSNSIKEQGVNPTVSELSLSSAPVLPNVSAKPPVVFAPQTSLSDRNSASQQAAKSASVFIDVPNNALYRTAAEYLRQHAIPEISKETVFRPTQAMTRREAVLLLAGAYSITPQTGVTSRFADIQTDDILGGYLETMVAKGYVSTGWIFRPNDAITKKELITLILRMEGVDSSGKDVVRQFANIAKFPRARVLPMNTVSRADAARIIHAGVTTISEG